MNHLSVIPLFLFTAAAVACGGSPGPDTPDGGTGALLYPDTDGDGFGDMAKGVAADQAPSGYIAQGGDCNDHDRAVHPGAREICDTIDNNCDGKIDDADPALDVTTQGTFYRDADSDGFGDLAATTKACAAPAGYVALGTDCDDTNAAVNPQAAEVCDHVDNNCNGQIDMADPALDLSTAHTFYRDADHDGYGASALSQVACDAPTGYVAQANDCNDNDATSHPNGIEVCDGADNDCDGGVDGTAAQPNRCSALVGSYSGAYTHHTDERVGSTIVNQMDCSGTGTASLQLGRTPALQGSFTCNYAGSLGGFMHVQTMTLAASVDLTGHVTGTITHTYDSFGPTQRTYTIAGTQTATGLTLSGTGQWLPNPMSAVPWGVTFSVSASR